MASSLPTAEPETPPQQVEQLRAQIRWLELRVKDLEARLFGRQSERRASPQEANNLEWEQLLKDAQVLAPATTTPTPTASPEPAKTPAKIPTLPKGPKPLDPALPREVIQVPAPDLKKLVCPVTGKPMRPGFVERIEVLARRAPEYYVKAYERTVFVSPAKTAPVYAEWPADVLPRARVHASIVAHIAAEHFCEHQPYHRLEKHLERIGVDLPRVCQVSLMAQLNERMQPLVSAIQAQVFASGYIHLDATPIDLYDPDRPGAVRESTLWAYRAADGPVWFEFRLSKSPQHPAKRLEHYGGLLQSDGATGLDQIGQADHRVTHLSCWSHGRRYVIKASDAGETGAAAYLKSINAIFRVDRLARHFRLSEGQRDQLRRAHSLPVAEKLFAQALADLPRTPPKTRLGQALGYLLGQKPSLLRCLTEPRAEIENNAVERAIRPLKIGAKNWMQIGHPKAGPRLANLFTLVENCRQEGVDPEAYLIDIIARLPDHPMKRIDELLPRQWKKSRVLPSVAAG